MSKAKIDLGRLHWITTDASLYPALKKADYSPNMHTPATIIATLKGMGLDLNDDATYSLLESGLTRKKFDEMSLIYLSRAIIYNFNLVQFSSYGDTGSKYHHLKHLNWELEQHKNEFQGKTLPLNTDQYTRHIYQFVMDEYGSGRLKAQEKDLEIDVAVTILSLLKGEEQKPGFPLNQEYYLSDMRITELIKIVCTMDASHQSAFFTRAKINMDEIKRLDKVIPQSGTKTKSRWPELRPENGFTPGEKRTGTDSPQPPKP